MRRLRSDASRFRRLIFAFVLGAVVAARSDAQADQGRLSARPVAPLDTAIYGERHVLSASGEGYSYVPGSYQPDRPAALCLLFHGAGGDAQRFIRRFRAIADSTGVILLAPQSRLPTWDLVSGEFGYDVLQIDAMLRDAFRRYRVDRSRMCVAGFSDGASYALSLGRVNGDLFSHILAFSPGFIVTAHRAHGKPTIFISHGSADEILPIDRTGRRVRATLERDGYRIEFREFTGGHTVPMDVARAAFATLRQPSSRSP